MPATARLLTRAAEPEGETVMSVQQENIVNAAMDVVRTGVDNILHSPVQMTTYERLAALLHETVQQETVGPQVVVAKVQCISRKETIGSKREGDTWVPSRVFTYEFHFVTGEQNKRFWEASPGGTLQLQAIREDLYAVGNHYYIDFVPAPAAESN